MNSFEKKADESITVEGQDFAYVKDRLIGGRVFANQDKTEYLRTASAAEIAGEANLTKDLYERGFPVPKVIATGTLKDGTAYYTERSIGDRHFGQIFKQNTKTEGHITEESLDAFINVIKRYCAAQFNYKNFVPHNPDSLAKISAFEIAMRSNPPAPDMEPMFAEVYQKANERLSKLPWGYLQPDLNPFNILHDGIIDFELADFGPIGYDTVTNIYFERMWPTKEVSYHASDEQIAKYVAAIDAIAKEHDLPPMSSFTDDFLVLKAIWASAKPKESEEGAEKYADLWKWRANVRDWCVKQYLKGEPIDSNQFQVVGGEYKTATEKAQNLTS